MCGDIWCSLVHGPSVSGFGEKKILVFWNSKWAYKAKAHTQGEDTSDPQRQGTTLFYLVKTTLTDYSEIMIWELGVQMSERCLG